MSRIKSNYENTFWSKLVRFVNGDSDIFSEASGYEVDVKEISEQKHNEFFSEAEWNKEKSHKEELIEKYTEWPESRGVKIYNKLYRIVAVIMCLTIIAALLFVVSKLPRFGEADNPANNEVYERYVEKGITETGAVNDVAGLILDYRAFDTLGESHVLFIATVLVLILLRIDDRKGGKKAEEEENDRKLEPKNDLILQHCARLLTPVIFLFGVYIILGGHLGPGGGFSGGAVIGAGLILYLNAFGFKKTERFFTYRTFSVVSVCALCFYSISKAYSFFTGANGLESIFVPGVPGRILSAGLILPLDICVGAVVACTIYAFYALFRKGGI